MIYSELTLNTTLIALRPLRSDDYAPFFVLSQEPDMWEYFSLNLSDPDQLKKWMAAAEQERLSGVRVPFTIVENKSGRIAGSTSLGNISYHDLRLEIGWSWLGKEFRGTNVNRHCKYAMMKYVFEQLHFERIEFKTDVLNVRARKGLEKIGGREEGIFRSHMTMWNDRRRDSVYFSILKKEWPAVKQSLFKDIQDEDH